MIYSNFSQMNSPVANTRPTGTFANEVPQSAELTSSVLQSGDLTYFSEEAGERQDASGANVLEGLKSWDSQAASKSANNPRPPRRPSVAGPIEDVRQAYETLNDPNASTCRKITDSTEAVGSVGSLAPGPWGWAARLLKWGSQGARYLFCE